MQRLDYSFFARDTLEVARNLLGKLLVHQVNGTRISGRIVETEAYTGWDDAASHGHTGKTARNTPMFGSPGTSYVYLCYGMYWLLNIVAKPEGVDYPAAVLIRAVEPVDGHDQIAGNRPGRRPVEWTSGPGRLTLALGIDRRFNGISLTDPASTLFLEYGNLADRETIVTGARVGITAAEPWRSIPWRFSIAGNRFVSGRS